MLAGNTWFYDDIGDINVSADDYSKLPALEFLYGDYWLQALPEDYMHSYAGSYWACFTEADTEANFILGSAFLRGSIGDGVGSWLHDYKSRLGRVGQAFDPK